MYGAEMAMLLLQQLMTCDNINKVTGRQMSGYSPLIYKGGGSITLVNSEHESEQFQSVYDNQ